MQQHSTFSPWFVVKPVAVIVGRDVAVVEPDFAVLNSGK